jgi:hypothetical protein
MASEQDILDILSRHRKEDRPSLPRPLPLSTIIYLLQHTQKPGSKSPTSSDLWMPLKSLLTRGEVFRQRNRFCVARPLIVSDCEPYEEIRFIGDRAYLPLVHEVLATGQDRTETLLHTGLTLNEAREQLEGIGIPWLTWDDLLNQLPDPAKPRPLELRDKRLTYNPLESISRFRNYQPRQGAEQSSRFIFLVRGQRLSTPLILLPDGTWIWHVDRQYSEINSDSAYLAMFYLDDQHSAPLPVRWSSASTQLDMSHTLIPSSYKRLIEMCTQTSRYYTTANSDLASLYQVRPRSRSIITAALNRLRIPV